MIMQHFDWKTYNRPADVKFRPQNDVRACNQCNHPDCHELIRLKKALTDHIMVMAAKR